MNVKIECPIVECAYSWESAEGELGTITRYLWNHLQATHRDYLHEHAESVLSALGVEGET